MPKKKHYTPTPALRPSGRGYLKTGRLSEAKIKPLSAAEKQKKASAEAKRVDAEIDRLKAARRGGGTTRKVKPTPLTPAQIRSKEAEKTRGRIIPPSSNPFGRIAEELEKSRKPKKRRRKR